MRPVGTRCTPLKDAGAPYTAGAGAIYTDTRAGAAQAEKASGLALVGSTTFCVALCALPVLCTVEAVDLYGG